VKIAKTHKNTLWMQSNKYRTRCKTTQIYTTQITPFFRHDILPNSATYEVTGNSNVHLKRFREMGLLV